MKLSTNRDQNNQIKISNSNLNFVVSDLTKHPGIFFFSLLYLAKEIDIKYAERDVQVLGLTIQIESYLFQIYKSMVIVSHK